MLVPNAAEALREVVQVGTLVVTTLRCIFAPQDEDQVLSVALSALNENKLTKEDNISAATKGALAHPARHLRRISCAALD